LGDERLVVTGIPLAVVQNLSEVDPGREDQPGGRELHPRTVLDPLMAEPLGPEPENLRDEDRVPVRHQFAINEVVTGLGSVDPLALPDRLSVAHPDVLRELLPVELRERAEDVVEHPTGGAREIELLSERVE